MQKQRIIIIAAIALAVMAVIMIKIYLDQQRVAMLQAEKKKLASAQENQVSVLVAKKDIPRGVVIEVDSLQAQIIPRQYVQPQAVTSLDRISGMITTASIAKGEQVTLSKLVQPKASGTGGTLAENTPVGKRAITISVDNIASLLGMIKPGDYVDVIAILPIPVQTADGKQAAQPAAMPLFQNILVLAVGQQIGSVVRPDVSGGRYSRGVEEKKESSSPLITLALSPQEASLIAFVQEQGKIRLILRSPADSKLEPVQPGSWDTLFQYIMPNMPVKPPQEKTVQKPPEGDYVEINRGLNKEKVLLTK